MDYVFRSIDIIAYENKKHMIDHVIFFSKLDAFSNPINVLLDKICTRSISIIDVYLWFPLNFQKKYCVGKNLL